MRVHVSALFRVDFNKVDIVIEILVDARHDDAHGSTVVRETSDACESAALPDANIVVVAIQTSNIHIKVYVVTTIRNIRQPFAVFRNATNSMNEIEIFNYRCQLRIVKVDAVDLQTLVATTIQRHYYAVCFWNFVHSRNWFGKLRYSFHLRTRTDQNKTHEQSANMTSEEPVRPIEYSWRMPLRFDTTIILSSPQKHAGAAEQRRKNCSIDIR